MDSIYDANVPFLQANIKSKAYLRKVICALPLLYVCASTVSYNLMEIIYAIGMCPHIVGQNMLLRIVK